MTTAAYTEIRAPRWGKEEREYQIAPPRKPYVYSTGANSALMHKVRHIRLRWLACGPNGNYLVRLQSPRMFAVTNCGRWIPIDSTKGRTCSLPKPETVLCAACHGQGRNFGHGEKHAVPIELAKVRLGCVEESH